MLAIFLLTACSIHIPSGLTKDQNLLAWQDHKKLISKIIHYQARGAFAYFSKKQKIYARFNWQQNNPDCYRLILTDIFGDKKIDLYVQPNGVQLFNKKNTKYISDDLEVMLQRITGILVPLKNLHQWILGLPGDTTDFTINSYGYLHQLNYSYNNHNWIVTYRSYHNDIVPRLPSNLELREGKNRIKLKIDNWSL